jgi:O-antigen ligase
VRDEFRDDLDRATSGRSSLVGNGVRIARDNAIAGVGLGGFRREYAERTGLRGEEPKRAASHSTPVTVAAEGGVPGMLLYGWLLLTALVVPLRRASRSFAGRVSLIVGLALMAIAVHSLFYDAFFEDPLTWGLIGVASVVGSWRGDGK